MERKNVEAIDYAAVKVAVKAINDDAKFVELLGGKIKLVGAKKGAVIDAFQAAVIKLDDTKDAPEIPDPIVDAFNNMMVDDTADGTENPPAAEEETPDPPKKEDPPAKEDPPKKEDPPARKDPPMRTAKSMARKEDLRKFIAEGKHTKVEIWEAMEKLHPEFKRSTVMTYISDGKNPKYNPFDLPVEIDDKGIVKFGAKG